MLSDSYAKVETQSCELPILSKLANGGLYVSSLELTAIPTLDAGGGEDSVALVAGVPGRLYAGWCSCKNVLPGSSVTAASTCFCCLGETGRGRLSGGGGLGNSDLAGVCGADCVTT